MSYQVLARKWRPRIFREMVGQEHVLKALINALDRNQLHHAYLFTGTRGVGKTTIARILAKCLNCDSGVTSEPCDQCAACTEINEGRFVDLIEVDAASRTKVEDTRELLDNVQYTPTRGRYKVYLIDEVHMLSNSSFNALLKTLEEPPPHVKFLLATTDPQKLPATVLSRCLQFNLKNLSAERIVEYLEQLLEREMIPFEASALWLLARSADGSMRDALSLTDQAIGFGNGKLAEADVSKMLGTIDQQHIHEIVRALADSDGPRLLARVEAMAEQAPDYRDALASLINLLHRLAIAQVLPEAMDNTFGDRDQVLELARQLPGEDVQLYYQIAILGRRDLPLAPDPRGGFEMVLLRMLTFKPQGVTEAPAGRLPGGANRRPEPASEQSSAPAQAISEQSISEQSVSEQPPAAGPAPETGMEAVDRPKKPEPGKPAAEEPAAAKSVQAPPPAPPDTFPVADDNSGPLPDLDTLTPDNWNQLALSLPAGGVIQNTLLNCQLLEQQSDTFSFLLDADNSTLYDESHQQRLADLLGDYFQQPVSVKIQVGRADRETPAQMAGRLKAERQARALAAMKADAGVQALVTTFSARLVEESITPIDH